MNRYAVAAAVFAALALAATITVALVLAAYARHTGPREESRGQLIPPLTITWEAADPTGGLEANLATTVPPATTSTAPRPTSTTVRASRGGAPRTTTTMPAASPPVEEPETPDPGAVYLGRFRVTCYQLTANNTATGTRPGPGTIAVDPAVIRLGTRLRLAGIGEGTARDTGSAIKGNKLDWWRASCAGWANPTVDVWRLP